MNMKLDQMASISTKKEEFFIHFAETSPLVIYTSHIHHLKMPSQCHQLPKKTSLRNEMAETKQALNNLMNLLEEAITSPSLAMWPDMLDVQVDIQSN